MSTSTLFFMALTIAGFGCVIASETLGRLRGGDPNHWAAPWKYWALMASFPLIAIGLVGVFVTTIFRLLSE